MQSETPVRVSRWKLAGWLFTASMWSTNAAMAFVLGSPMWWQIVSVAVAGVWAGLFSLLVILFLVGEAELETTAHRRQCSRCLDKGSRAGADHEEQSHCACGAKGGA